MNLYILPNFLGFVAVVLYALTLAPTLVRQFAKQFQTSKFNLFLTKHRRHVGVVTFIVALAHGVSVGIERQINFSLASTWITYFQGITMMTVMILLAITSNNFSVKYLKRNWKRLHYLTYLILIILPWHILDKMNPGWTWFTPVVLIIVFVLIILELLRIIRLKQKTNI